MSKAATKAIKERLNILDVVRRYVTLRRVGGRWVAPCPFHQETKPSFSVNEEEGFFYCFGCQASGDLFDFYGRVNGLDFRESLEQLAAETGVSLEDGRAGRGGSRDTEADRERDLRRRALKMHELASSFYVSQLEGPVGRECRDYVARRGIAPEMMAAFGIGWSAREWRNLAETLRRAGFTPEEGVAAGLLAASDKGAAYDRFRGRLMFPIKNLSGRVIAFGGRIIAEEDSAKYINSADSPLYKKGDNLYGLFQARRGISVAGSALLTEGYMDVLTLHQYGYANACGVLGTALTREQVKRLAGFCGKLELLFDGDGAGRKAALRSCEMILTRGLACRVVLMPDGEDIDSLLRGDDGKAAFERLRAEAPEGLDFCIRALSSQAPRDAVEWVKNFLRQVKENQPELTHSYGTRLSRGLGLDEKEVLKAVGLGGAGRAGGAAKAAGLSARPGGMPDGRAHAQSDGLTAGRTGGRVGGRAQKPLGTAGAGGAETQIMRFIVRFPRHLPVLRDCGAEFVVQDPWNRGLWEKIAASEPEFSADDVLADLDDKEREFWFRSRLEAPPAGTEQEELADISAGIARICSEQQGKNCLTALRRTSAGDAFDLNLLRALQETVRRKHGQH